MEKIIEKFKKVNSIQAQLLALCDEKMTCIAEQKMVEANAVIKQEMLALHDMECALKEMKVSIEEACIAHGYEEGKLNLLFPHMKTEEKETLMACQRYAISYEKMLKNKLKKSERQVEAKMALPEIIHKMRVQHMQENGLSTTLYNKKY